jgi:HEAT repeat protein
MKHVVIAIGLVATTLTLGAQTSAQWQDVIRNLRHPNVATRLDALKRLTEANYSAAAEPVAALLVDPDDKVQLAALDAELTFFVSDRVSGARGFLGDGKSRAQQAFEAGPLVRASLRAAPAIFDRLLMAMRDENPRVRFDAIHTLGVVAEAPVTGAQALALAAELDHYDPIIRTATARVLGRLKATAAAPALLIAVDDSSELVRTFAVEALGLLRDDRVVGPARGYATRSKGDLARASMLALARVGAREDIETFREQLMHRDAFIRRVGAEGLGRAGDRESLPALERLAASEKAPSVRLAAMFALQLLGQVQTHLIAAAAAEAAQAAQASDYLFDIGRPAMPGITEALKVAVEPGHKVVLAQLVGYLGSADDRLLVEPLVKDRDSRVRRAATVALERIQRGS